MRRTDTGRAVYGGGGIEPDIKVEAGTFSEAQGTIWTNGLFMFVRELMAGRVAVATGFKRDAIEFDHQPRPDEFVVNDQIMKAYRDFMVDTQKRMMTDTDAQLQRAIAEIPQSAQLAERARKLTRSSKK
jgi:hypothetical protein